MPGARRLTSPIPAASVDPSSASQGLTQPENPGGLSLAKIEMAIRDAIARGARKQVRSAATPLRRDVRRLRQAVRELRAQLAALREVAARWTESHAGRGWQPVVSEDEARAARLSPGLIRKLRNRLALSQAAVARLVGVSPAAVVQWEQGRATPAGKNRAALVGLRRVGRRQAKRLLATVTATPGKPRCRVASRRRRARRARRR
jgi:DNA-binding XRE family transcriptional regulator